MNMLSGKTKPFFPPSEDRTLRFQEFVCNYSYCLSTFLIRREALEQLDHWFDNRLKYAEEYELFVRIAYRWDARYLAGTLVSYRIHPRMNTLQLQGQMAQEYEITLDQLRSMVDGFDEAYPDIVRRIHYLRDFSTAKFLLPQGENARVRTLMKPYCCLLYTSRCV